MTKNTLRVRRTVLKMTLENENNTEEDDEAVDIFLFLRNLINTLK